MSQIGIAAAAVSNCSNDGLEPNGEEIDCEWHDNILEGCICGFRIKAPWVGPMYAYRNIFFDNGEDYRNCGGGDPMLPAPVRPAHAAPPRGGRRAASRRLAPAGCVTPFAGSESVAA